MKVYLPIIKAVRLNGMQPVFKQNIDRAFRSGVNIVLGGNGLGKTTTMQAIAFALTGGASKDTEPDKSFRWDHRWFFGRVREDLRRASSVEIDIALGSSTVTLRRHFDSSRLDGVRIGEAHWVDGKLEASDAFLAVLRKAGYRTYEDFSFLLLRLLYLSEDRRLVAWDADAQARILMLLNPDIVDEGAFRKARADLTFADTRRRHAHVAVVKLHDKLEKTSTEGEFKGKIHTPPTTTSNTQEGSKREELKRNLQDMERLQVRRRPMEEEYSHHVRALDDRSAEIESLREQIDEAEVAVVQATLKKAGAAKSLPISKLLEFGICPSCGTSQPALQLIAQKHHAKDACVLCGSLEAIHEDVTLSALQSQLAEKLKAQTEINRSRRRMASRLDSLRREETQLFIRASEIRRELELVTPNSDGVLRVLISPSSDPDELRNTLQEQKQVEANLLVDVEEHQIQVKRTYQSFLQGVSDRLEYLQDLYSKYATHFLGLKCELIHRDTPNRLFMLHRLVPKFNNVVRETPESCSEAQQFFLDIAFRMAVIDLAQQLSGSAGSFLCETPENALDFSYIDNVSEMFTAFAKQGHSVILTANIQREGLARQLMAGWPKPEDSQRVMQLLDLGQLSEVQKQKEGELRKYARA